MQVAQTPSTEADRLAALQSFEVLDTESEEVFDNLVTLAARLTDSPIALVSMIDAKRQWFKARHGIDVVETHRDYAFCAHTILDPTHPLVVENATVDPRFQDNPLVTGALGFRAYLGIPLLTSEGHALGSLCVIDRVPRHYDSGIIGTMQTLSRAVVLNLELRRALLRTRKAVLIDPLSGSPNRYAATAAYYAVGEVSPEDLFALIDPEWAARRDEERSDAADWNDSTQAGRRLGVLLILLSAIAMAFTIRWLARVAVG